MGKIILMRHGISEGNERQIIQGKINYKLSAAGITQLQKLDLTQLRNIDNIYCSHLLRAIETANIVKGRIKYEAEIKIDNIIREVSAGVLDGKSKKYCEEYLKDYYNIYLKREDYNDIPLADTWQYTQARALIFLEKYLEKGDYCDLIVTHAAFMRCMINVILYRNRNTPIELSNCKIYEFENPLKNIKYYKYDIAKSSEVYKISCYDSDYIMKRKTGCITDNDINEQIIASYLNHYFPTPEIIAMENRDGYYLKIIKYLEGYHKFGKLTKEEVDLITKRVYDMYLKMKEIQLSSVKRQNVLENLKKMKKLLLNKETQKILNNLLTNKRFIQYLGNCQYSLIHNDLHRSNILFDNNNVNIIDYEAISLCPSILQLASYISTCYLIEDDDINYLSVLKKWPEKHDIAILENFILYRLIYGISFFDKKIISGNYDASDIEIKEKYMKALRRIKNERNSN